MGASFLDISGLAASRPDMHLGRWRRWGAGHAPLRADEYDCVHYCLPGPTDTFARLVFNILRIAPPGADRDSEPVTR